MNEKNKLIITPDIKIHELLDSYPELEDVFIEISPLFKKLKNPVLRRTITRVTTLKQASVVGKVSLNEMINKLRTAAGQVPEEIIPETSTQTEKPVWANNENIKIRYDAREDLDNGIQPLNRILREAKEFEPGDKYLLITAFIPAPIIELLNNNGFECYSDVMNEKEVRNYFLKK